MIYNIENFYFKDFIIRGASRLRDEFTNVQGLNTSDLPPETIGHYATVNEGGKFKVLALKDMTRWNEDLRPKLPILTMISETIGEKCRSIGYCIYEPGAKILPHENTEDDFESHIAVFLPLIVPDGDCGYSEQGVHGKWMQNKPVIIDQSVRHSIWNNTDSSLINVVIEVEKDGTYR